MNPCEFVDSKLRLRLQNLLLRSNLIMLLRGCIKDWKAFSCWNPSNGGLDYLQERTGPSIVEAMLSRSAPVFNGDIRSHERVPLPFSTFSNFCKKHIQHIDVENHIIELEGQAGSDLDLRCYSPEDAHQIYLAQVPILNNEDKERVQLETLREDIQMPLFLEEKELASINLWMNNARTRSSTHYDPHHNLLCVVAGCKQVILWPPFASPSLYPMPIYGEASNHSSVPLEKPDFLVHPRARCLAKYSQKVTVHAGDAIFIPEGWFHQVDSDDLTIAVNFWWRSSLMSSMSEHMDAYYLRRILKRMVDKEMNEVLHMADSAGVQNMETHGSVSADTEEAGYHNLKHECEDTSMNGSKVRESAELHDMEPHALQALHRLVSLVHDYVSISDQGHLVESTSSNDSTTSGKTGSKKTVAANLFLLEDDPVAKIIWILGPLTLQSVFLVMAKNFPRTLEALVLHLLSPVGAEVLTRKFDEMDQQITEESRNNFYQAFYGVFDDQYAAMDSILQGKESFASKAFKNVLDQYVGLDLSSLK